MKTILINKISLSIRIGFFFILLCPSVFSQIDSTRKFHIYTSPLQALDIFSRPMITLGGEYIIMNKIGVAIEGGVKHKDVDDYDSTIVDSKGYSYRIELKYYDAFKIESERLQSYLSIEYRYIKDDYNSKFDYYANTQFQDLVTDNYAVLKNIYIGNIKYGIVINFSKWFYMDCYAGIGMRIRDVKNINRTFNEDLGHEHTSPEYFWTIRDFEEESGSKLNISLGVKVGIKL